MGILHQNLLSLLLDKGDFSIAELADKAEHLYGFNKHEMALEFELATYIHSDKLILTPEDKYHKVSEFADASTLLEFLKRAPRGCFNANPLWPRFYADLESKGNQAKEREAQAATIHA